MELNNIEIAFIVSKLRESIAINKKILLHHDSYDKDYRDYIEDEIFATYEVINKINNISKKSV